MRAGPHERARTTLRAGQQLQRFMAGVALRLVEVGCPLATLAQDRADRMASTGNAGAVALRVVSPVDLDLDDPPRPLARESGSRLLHGVTGFVEGRQERKRPAPNPNRHGRTGLFEAIRWAPQGAESLRAPAPFRGSLRFAPAVRFRRFEEWSDQPRGANAMIAMPARVTAVPKKSHLSGATPSTSQSQSNATNT